jgi:hypothetical protein
MSKKTAEAPATATEVAAGNVGSASAVLATAIRNEKSQKDIDADLLGILEASILRVDATANAWEKAAIAIEKLAGNRAQARLERA